MANVAATTASGLARTAIVYGAGTGVGIFLLVNNGHALKDYAKEMSRATVHYISRPDYQRNSTNGNDSSTSVLQLVRLPDGRQVLVPMSQSGDLLNGYDYANANNGDSNALMPPSNTPPHLIPIMNRLESLSSEIAYMRSSSKETTTLAMKVGGVVLVVGVAGAVMYISGLSLGDLMYVTKKHFNQTIENLREGVHGLAKAVGRVRAELSEKIGIVEKKVDASRAAIEQKIETEVSQVKIDIEDVAKDVKNVRDSQSKVEEIMNNLDDKIFNLDDRMQDSQHQIRRANRGIALLCKVVADALLPDGRVDESMSSYVQDVQRFYDENISSSPTINSHNSASTKRKSRVISASPSSKSYSPPSNSRHDSWYHDLMKFADGSEEQQASTTSTNFSENGTTSKDKTKLPSCSNQKSEDAQVAPSASLVRGIEHLLAASWSQKYALSFDNDTSSSNVPTALPFDKELEALPIFSSMDSSNVSEFD